MNFLNSLNEAQRQAVTLDKQSGLIIAGAGSGKTKVLTTRIAYLVKNLDVPAYNILAVTFTNKAAKEMLERLNFAQINTKELWVGTFHSLCNKVLRIHHQEAKLPKGFYILDSNDQLSFLKRVMRNNDLDPKALGADNIVKFINNMKEQGIRPQAITKNSTEKMVYDLYQKSCDAEGCVDFSELLLRCYELLKNNEKIRGHYANKFHYILVDEFQDTNDLQYKWLLLLSEIHKCVFAVGDGDQSIYSFRGANVKNSETFVRDFSPTVIKLEQNYRSLGNILKASNALIAKNENRVDKALWTDKGDGDLIFHYHGFNEDYEAGLVAEKISMYRRKQIPFKEMAILYRTNAQSRHFEKVLNAHKIPFVIYGGFKFFDRQEVKHAMAYLRLIHNPEDNIAFSRVCNIPARGIGATTINKLEKLAKENNKSLWEAVNLMTGKPKEKLEEFKSKIEEMCKMSAGKKLEKMVEVAIIYSGLEDMYKVDKQEGPERLDNLYELVSAAVEFRKEQPSSSIEDFFSNSVLDSDAKLDKKTEDGDEVKLMSIHASKGLEFKLVFIVGLEENIFPHINNLDDDALEEERRLMYVAMTRAKEYLYLIDVEERLLMGQRTYQIPSRFLDEVPKTLIKKITA